MRTPPVHLPKKRWLLFCALYSAPVLGALTGSAIYRPHWTFFVALAWAFFSVRSLLASMTSGRIEGNWGAIERSEHPVRFWLQIGIWIATTAVASAYPVAFALHQPR